MAITLNGTNNQILGVPGQVLQAVSFSTATPFSTTSGTPTATPITQNITPTSASSKILIIVGSTLGIPVTGMNGLVNLYRNGTNLVSNSYPLYMSYGAAQYLSFGFCLSYLDSPSTTSSTTYAVYAWRDGAAGTIYVGARYDSYSQITSTITLMEIAA